MEIEGGIGMMRRKAEIDTSAQFRSVKEAVLLYDEQVLATEAVNKIQQIQGKSSAGVDKREKAELVDSKESLRKAREDAVIMESCISSLQEELQRTRRELQRFKELEKSSSTSDMISKQQVRTTENFKFIEDSDQFDNEVMMDRDEVVKNKVGFQKRYVTFGNHSTPCSRVGLPPPPNYSNHAAVLQRHPSLRKKKKKSLIPFIGGIFSRKKGSSSEMM